MTPEFRAGAAGDDVVVNKYGDEVGRPPTNLRRQKETAGRMREMSQALEEYQEVWGGFPVPPAGVVDVKFLSLFLVPKFRDTIPMTDAWKNPIRYCSDGDTYLLISFGTDGKPDIDYVRAPVESGVFFDLIHDLVMQDHRFIRFPKGQSW